MLSVTLSPSERPQVEETVETTRAHRLRDRYHALLMAARARPPPPLATAVGLTPRTVQRWLQA